MNRLFQLKKFALWGAALKDISSRVAKYALMLHHTKTLGVIQVDESVWKKLTREEKQEIERICNEKLEQYYSRFKAAQTEDTLK